MAGWLPALLTGHLIDLVGAPTARGAQSQESGSGKPGKAAVPRSPSPHPRQQPAQPPGSHPVERHPPFSLGGQRCHAEVGSNWQPGRAERWDAAGLEAWSAGATQGEGRGRTCRARERREGRGTGSPLPTWIAGCPPMRSLQAGFWTFDSLPSDTAPGFSVFALGDPRP